MRNTAHLLATALLSLIAGPAFAQCTSMPANSVCGRLAIPPGGGSAVAIPFAAFAPALAPSFNWIRLSGIQNPTTGFGLELGYDGTEASIQSYSNRAALTLSPIFYTASSHKFLGSVGVGITPPVTTLFEVYPSQTIAGSRLFAISNTENGRVNSTPGPIELTWGASNGSPWDATVIGTDANVITFTTYAKQDTFDFVPFQLTGHLTAGTGSGIVGHRVQAYIDSTTTTPRGGTGLEVLMRNDSTGGDIWGTNIGASYHGTTTTGALHGTEYDIEALGATVKYKFGMVIGSTQADVATVTGTLAINGTSDTIPGSAAYWVTSFGGGGAGSAIGFDTAVLTVKETGGGTPITGRLWYAGGFSVPTGLDWGRMTFSDAAIKLPNNAPIKAYNAAGSSLLPILNLNSSNVIAIGAGATVDQTSGSASFGVSTMIALAINGTLGNGYLELGNQSSNPSTPAANKVRLYSNSAGVFSFKNANGFVVTLGTTANTADRAYTFPDVTGTVDLAESSATFTGAKTFGAAGNVGKLIIAGTTSGTTILNATAIASGTLTLPAATDTLVGKATTDIFTNKTYDTAGTGNVFKINGVQITNFSGLGNTVALVNSPGFTTPTLGVASATSISFGGSALANYVAATSWTPTDGSGAALTFSSVSASYTRIGNMVFAYALLTYPATGSGASAIISGFPIATPNANYAQNPCTFFSGASVTNSYSMRMDPNAITAHIFNNAGASTTNAQLTGVAVIFSCAYPVT